MILVNWSQFGTNRNNLRNKVCIQYVLTETATGTWGKLLKRDPSFWGCISCLWAGMANCFVYKLCTSKTRSAYILKPKGGGRLIFSYLKFKPNPTLTYGCFRLHHVRNFLRVDMKQQYIIAAVESRWSSFLVTWFNSYWTTGLKILDFSELGQAASDGGYHVGTGLSPMRIRIALAETIFGVLGGSVVWPCKRKV